MTKTANELWYKEAVFYELNIRAFADGNNDGIGDFQGAATRLDYVQELGITCIWLLPMYPSPLRDDGYDISDLTSIHPDLGSLDDFRQFIALAHDRGLRVIVDLVLNHTSDQHPWFQAARSDPGSPYRDYYVWSDTADRYSDTRIIFLDTETSNWTYDEQAGQYFWHRFYSHQPDLNWDNPQVLEEMFQVMGFWLDMGIDGFRADAVPYLIEREGTNCENLPETHEILKKIRRWIDKHYPGRILLAEANQWPEEVRDYFGDGDEFHMGFHFPVMPRLYMALKLQDTSSIYSIMRRTPPIPDTCQWCVFLRNHDELTLEMVTEEERQTMWELYAPEPRMRLNLGIRRRLTPLLDNDRRKLELLNSVICTLPGSPIIYYGDEIGMGDNIWLRDRNGVRTPMQWNDELNAGFSNAPPDKLYEPVIDDPVYGYQRVNVAMQSKDPNSMLNFTRRMLAMRKKHPALGLGTFDLVDTGNPAILAYRREWQGETILAIHNFSDAQHKFEVAESGRDILTDKMYGGGITNLQPFSYLWLMRTRI
ncbi:MAG: maltose alpha-D-glucosyltransferase [Anaerolineales bacterium]|nr:maltose alpha-D-glucosyltransferase [Anaerolineales bacterium]